MTDQTGAVYRRSRGGVLRKIIDSGLFPSALRPRRTTASWPSAILGAVAGGMRALPTVRPSGAAVHQGSPASDLRERQGRTIFPETGRLDGVDYRVRGNLPAVGGIGGILVNPVRAGPSSASCQFRTAATHPLCFRRPRQSTLPGNISWRVRTPGLSGAPSFSAKRLPSSGMPVAPTSGGPIYQSVTLARRRS